MDGRGLVTRSYKIVCGSAVCVHDPRITAQKLESEVCAAKSSDCPNPYFAHNIYCTYIHPVGILLITTQISTHMPIHYFLQHFIHVCILPI